MQSVEDRLVAEREVTRNKTAIENNKSERVKSAVYQKTLIAAVTEKENKDKGHKVDKPEPTVLQVSNKVSVVRNV